MQTEVAADPIGDALIDRLIPMTRPLTYCEHLHSGRQPFYAASALPAAFFCGACFHSTFITRTLSTREGTQTQCDTCLLEVGDPGALGRVLLTSGLANLIGNVCRPCEQDFE
ncbi:MAG: hypothetical protein ACRDX9_14320 [Acidimicrobiia bacterium]